MSAAPAIPAWLPASPFEAAAAAFATSPPSSLTSDIPHPTSHIDPTLLPDPLSDTLLAKIAAGTECLAAIASFHNIPFPRFTLWLLEPATQQKLSDLSVAIASAARLTATAALPDIVRGLKTTIDQLQHQTHTSIAPGGADHLRAESLILRRHRATISASSLLYRISRFTVPSPKCHRSTSRSDAIGAPSTGNPPQRTTLPRMEALPNPDVRAPSPSTASSSLPTSHIPLPTSDLSPMPIDEATQTLIDELELTGDQAADFRANPRAWLREHLHEYTDIPFVFDDEYSHEHRAEAATTSADDG